jgi:hypothetical protein
VPQGLLGAFLLGNLLHLLGIGTRGEEEKYESQAWRYTPVIPTVRRLKQEDKEFKASLDYRVRPEREREREKQREGGGGGGGGGEGKKVFTFLVGEGQTGGVEIILKVFSVLTHRMLHLTASLHIIAPSVLTRDVC